MEPALVALILYMVLRTYFKLTESRPAKVPSDVVAQLADAHRKKKLHWTRLGNTESPRYVIVLLHGFAQSHKAWLNVAEQIVKSHPTATILLPDLIGFGKSSQALPNVGLSQPLYTEQIEFMLRTEQVSKLPIILAGISMGGGAALHTAAEFRARAVKLNVARLILVAPAGLPNDILNGLQAFTLLARGAFFHRFLYLPLMILGLVIPACKRVARWLPFLVSAPTYDLKIDNAFWTKIRELPCTLIWGDNDSSHDYALHKDFVKIMHANVLTVKNTGHIWLCNNLNKLHLEDFKMWDMPPKQLEPSTADRIEIDQSGNVIDSDGGNATKSK